MFLLHHIWDVLCFVVVMGGPVLVSLRAAACAEDSRPPTHLLLVMVIWWCAIQCSVGIALGLIGQLRLMPLLICEIAIALMGALLLHKKRRAAPSWIRLRVPEKADWRFVALGVVVTMAAGTLLTEALTQPIAEFDSLAYHLPQIAQWYQEGSFVALPNLRQIARYPFSWEVLQVLFVLPFGEDFAIGLTNLCAWMFFGLSSYRLARCFGATPLAAMSSAAICISVPDVALQVRTGLVDVALAAFFAVALYLLCEQRRAPSGNTVAACAAATGLMLGIKASAIVLACILAAVWIVLRAVRIPEAPLAQEQRRDASSPRFAILLIAGFVSLIWLGGFWYVRNWIEVGNPLGFVPLRIAGVEVFPGDEFYADLGRTSIARLFDIRSSTDWMVFWRAVQARGGIPFGLMITLLFALPWTLRRAHQHGTRRAILLMSALTGTLAVLYCLTPYTGDNGSHGGKITAWIATGFRYAFPLLATLSMLNALIATRVRLLLPVVWAGAVLSCVHLLIRHGDSIVLVWGTGFGLVALAVWFAALHVRSARRRKKATWLLLSAAMVAVLGITFVARKHRDRQRDVVYGRILSAIESVVPPGASVGYLMSLRSYPFYGRHLDRRVLFVPAGHRGRREWIQHMREQKIRVVAIGPMRKQFMERKELRWLREKDGPFRRISGDDPNDSMLFVIPDGPGLP